ncbi:hypothetical protein LPJ78_001767 [Coemansia sp. RSA 989]|nr:hypothetical protein BX667DRAFT_315234 [Coemansia mojavensis]KAJ1742836.1 hypothetical protein LPJ68_001538 [Coemansia sp. RSA 1086]KAJ1751461.1 hypothetical protein LPJ79_002039 [Coemansia sp. RSA 1821]KAJ1866506.1 hypothetical protein LPJ78_001767 [Coemansia sp. RSA 989]KAJ1873846.1 hypothetical protein LPJ55_001980 [Coemansia sp. RSA 990]KAJ2670415.1 hypothetical protein IWW42_003984 [Coemansia sp. RSA 1085]
MYNMRTTPPQSLDERQGYSGGAGNGLAVDTRARGFRDTEAPQTAPYRLNMDDRRSDISDSYAHASVRTQMPAGVHRSATAASAAYGQRAPSGTAELNPVTAWGLITNGGGQRTGAYRSPSHMDRGTRYFGRAEGAASPQQQRGRLDMFVTPTAHRASISTVLSGPHSADISRASSGHAAHDSRPFTSPRQRHSTATSRRHSQAEYDTYNERSVATTFGVESQYSRPNLDDSSMYAHTPGRDTALAAMHVMGRNPVPLGASGRLRSVSGTQDILTPEMPGGAAFGHQRTGSMASPNTRARAIEDTHNALTGGRRPVRPHASQTWHVEGAGRDTASETVAWGVGRMRTESMAQRGNGLAVDSPHRHRASYSGSQSATGSAQARGARYAGSRTDGNSSFASGGRRARHQSLQAKNGRTPIRSNRYFREEALSESDLKDQEFQSSDEEDFGDEEMGYGGDMVAQQKLIQKQQRSIYDLNLQCRMLREAMKAKTDQPYEALLDDFGRTCASNRRANRQIELMRKEIRALKDRCAEQEKAGSYHAEVESLQESLAAAQSQLAAEQALSHKRQQLVEIRDAKIRELEEKLAKECHYADHYHRKATFASCNAEPAPALPHDLSPRTRAGTTATSETMTLRAPSDISAADDPAAALRRAQGAAEQAEQQLHETERQRRALEDELKQTRKKMREYEEQRRMMQRELKSSNASRAALMDTADHAELSRLTRENETLADECDSLQRQLTDARAQLQANAEATLAAATSAIDLSAGRADPDGDADDVYGGVAQRAEIAKLKLEVRDLEAMVRMHEDNARQLADKLEANREQMRTLCHDHLRPCLRELTVGPAQAESAFNQLRHWSQLNAAAYANDETPTKPSRHTNYLGTSKGQAPEAAFANGSY